MTTTLTPTITKVHYKNLRIKFNVRYGLDEERRLDAYDSGLQDLKESMLKFGFKPNEPIEACESRESNEQGEVIYDILEGHRRYLVCLSIFEEDPGKTLGDDLAPGEVRIFVSPKPESLLKLVSGQIGANKTEPNTKMDICKAVYAAYTAMEGKSTEKLTKIGEELGLTRSMATFYRNVYELPVEVKDWIQESEVDSSTVTLSFTTALELVNYYKVEDASKLLLKALELVKNEPEKVKTFGKSVSRDWLHELAGEIRLGKKPKEKKVSKTTTQSQGNAIESDDDSGDIEDKTTNNQEYQSGNIVVASNVADFESNTSSDGINNSATKPITPPSVTTTKPKQEKDSPEKPSERIETLIRQKLKGDVGIAIANGKGIASEDKFLIELPLELGYEFSELVSAFLDPNSNNPETVIASATTVIEETEF